MMKKTFWENKVGTFSNVFLPVSLVERNRLLNKVVFECDGWTAAESTALSSGAEPGRFLLRWAAAAAAVCLMSRRFLCAFPGRPGAAGGEQLSGPPDGFAPEEVGGPGPALPGGVRVSSPAVHGRGAEGALQARPPEHARLRQEEEARSTGSSRRRGYRYPDYCGVTESPLFQLVKQANAAEDPQAPPPPSRKHPRSRSFGGLIKVLLRVSVRLQNRKRFLSNPRRCVAMVTAPNSRWAADGGEAGQTRLPRGRQPDRKKRRQRKRRFTGGKKRSGFLLFI